MTNLEVFERAFSAGSWLRWMVRRTCCNFKRVRYRNDYPVTDDRAYIEIHAKGCLTRSAANDRDQRPGP